MRYNRQVHRGIAQLVEYWSPKPWVVGSSPSAPAKKSTSFGLSIFYPSRRLGISLTHEVRRISSRSASRPCISSRFSVHFPATWWYTMLRIDDIPQQVADDIHAFGVIWYATVQTQSKSGKNIFFIVLSQKVQVKRLGLLFFIWTFSYYKLITSPYLSPYNRQKVLKRLLIYDIIPECQEEMTASWNGRREGLKIRW